MFRTLLVATLLCVPSGQIAFAQPAATEKSKGGNPPNARPPFPTPEQENQLFDEMKAMMDMTPEKLKARMHGLNQTLLRTTLSRAGFKDQKLQDEILHFVDEREASRATVRAAALKIYLTLHTKTPVTAPDAMEALIDNYVAAAAEAKAEQAAATKTLDLKIGFSHLPHLQAFLLLNGIIGDASSLTSDIISTGMLAAGSLDIKPEKDEATPPPELNRKDFDMQAFMEMTPAQLKARVRETNQKSLRTILSKGGFEENALQDDVLLFVDEQENSRTNARKAATKIYMALEPMGVPTDAQGMEVLLKDYLAAIEEVKAERAKATRAFDAKIGLSANPNLRALLLLNGIIGDASSMTSDIILTGSMAMGSLTPGI